MTTIPSVGVPGTSSLFVPPTVGVAAATPEEAHFLLHDVDWATYQAILRAFGDRRLRHTYDRGTLELMTHSRLHERIATLLGQIIAFAACELRLPFQSAGSTTLGREEAEKGFEPDQTFYLANELRVRGQDEYDPLRDPPPDLAVEVEITSPLRPRLPAFGAVGVPEVWHFKDDRVTILLLGAEGRYVESPKSLALPVFTADDLTRFVAQRNETDQASLLRNVVEHVRRAATETNRP